MPKKSHSEVEHQALVVLTIVVAVTGLVGAFFGFNGWRNEDLQAVDRLVRYNLDMTGGFVLTVRTSCLFFGITAFVTAVSAVVGWIGTRLNSKPITCVYNVSVLILGIVMFFLGVHAMGRQTAVTPIITRQIDDFCRADTFIRLTQHLACPNTAGMLASPVPCNAMCGERAQSLNMYGEGCLILTSLCNDWEYTTVAGSIAVGFTPPIYMKNSVDEVYCQRKCDHDLNCYGFAFNAIDTNCFLKSGNRTRYVLPEWTDGGAGANALTAVKIKGQNGVLSAFNDVGVNVARFMLTLGVLLILVGALTWCILYNQNINRPGKPTAGQVFLHLCCCGKGDSEFSQKVPLNDVESDGAVSS